MAAISRRSILKATGTASLVFALPSAMKAAIVNSPFHVGCISDEISPDFDHACSVIANDFGLRYVELRALWGKNLLDLPDADLAKAVAIVNKYKLQVTDIASPLFKTDWPGAPRSKFSPKNDSFGANFNFKQQDEVLEKSIAAARRFKTGLIRGFDFWRLDDPAPYRAAIDAKLLEAANTVGKQGLLLVLENEHECNTATGREAARTLAAVQSPHFKLNWDPGNAIAAGEVDAFPGGFDALPKDRIGHCHVKCCIRKPDGTSEWAAVGQGLPDWVAQFRALRLARYRHAVNLETHWRGAGTPEASSRISWAGMKEALEKSGSLVPDAVPGDWPKVDIQG